MSTASRDSVEPASATRAADAKLHDIASSFDWIRALFVTNTEAIWEDYRSGRRAEPALAYRPLDFDPDALRRSLLEIPIEEIENPLLQELLREKQLEVERQLTLLSLRGTDGFLQVSLGLFGDADPELLGLAETILSRVNAASEHRELPRVHIDGRELAERARQELDAYRKLCPDFPRRVVIRDDIAAGIMVSNGAVLVSDRARIPEPRVEGLLHHEIGTHVLTYFNGLRQPICQFASGLAHYDELQEGLGVLAELVSDGLSPWRLRALAARVVAVGHLVDGGSLFEVAERLERDCGLGRRAAFLTSLRVFRGGGLTKDVVYLRGLRNLLAHLAAGSPLEPLYLGKIGFEHLNATATLLEREVLQPPAVLPRFLATTHGRAQVERFRRVGVAYLSDADADADADA